MGLSDVLKSDKLSVSQSGAFKFKCDWSVLSCLVVSLGDSWEREYLGAGCERGRGLRQ